MNADAARLAEALSFYLDQMDQSLDEAELAEYRRLLAHYQRPAMSTNDNITAKAYWKPVRRGKYGIADLPEGWVVSCLETGKQLSSQRFPTQEDAEAAAPRILAAYLARVEAAQAQREAASQPPRPPAGRPYTEVESPVYGRGRVYHDQPGATEYSDGPGRGRVQIWDNS